MLLLPSSDSTEQDSTDAVAADVKPCQNRRPGAAQTRHIQRQGIGVYKVILLLIYGCCFWFLFKYLFWDQLQRRFFPEQDDGKYTDLLDKIDLNCDAILKSDQKVIQQAKLMRYNTHFVEKLILDADDRCLAIRKLFGFDTKPYSDAESDYPLAYGLIVYKNIVQVLFMLSSFYRSHNEYCIAVSGGADPMFKLIMEEVDQCFSNVRVLSRPRIDWGSYEIINSTFACLKVLSSSGTSWKYFQYLAGVDIPLKTNMEMVEILKQLNNTVNAEITWFQPKRIRSKRIESAPLPLYKASLSATVPRAAVDYIVESAETRRLLSFLLNTSIPDESFWGTLTGNVDKFPIPGGTDAAKWLQYREEFRKNHTEEIKKFERRRYRMRYYLSRYQLWDSHCRGKFYLATRPDSNSVNLKFSFTGKMASGSCIFGVSDLADLLRQPHLVAHKLYIDFEPAAFFCGLKVIHTCYFLLSVLNLIRSRKSDPEKRNRYSWMFNHTLRYLSGSDLADLLRQPHLVAHKLYIDFEPAAFFCGLKEIRSREKKPLQLDVQPYAEIPQVQLARGVPFENLSHPFWLY
ncbi:Core-2/I-Branching enzyme [Oesophagostomum dentatum]|uniref:Core-2/I-Branching enzyme n=1 Tax=Oesophagostomum dentatum TaxID=61180 RepID=A0A0B1TRN0_OESDE|nr:Core-2/I-Branching enzyme [Oesophagostomum dentatum]